VRQLVQAVQALSHKGVVHGDLKPDNILIETDIAESDRKKEHRSSTSLNCKLVDFGSSFFYDRPTVGSLATPEYVPPEVLDLHSRAVRIASETVAFYHKKCTVHSFDMWAIGVVLLEILVGFPVWFSYRARVEVDSRVFWACGLFTSRTGLRDPQKIIERQVAVISNLDSILEESPGLYTSWSATNSKEWSNARDLVKKLLNMRASTRISPQDALCHDFLKVIYH
jgi:serine/threonine protein kinase